MTKQKGQKNNLQIKPPVVVILGHVDHGKTSILDFIRKTKVAAGETGGITQHTGAYQIEHQDKKITFIDTPGHEAFSAMRSRGAKVADIAVLVIAAEEGLKPQTEEAIQHIQKTGLPFVVALNKIDKKEAQPEKIKQELIQKGITVESLGGEIPSVNTSAQTGQGIDELLEMISLIAEMEELKTDPEQTATGVIVESHCDNQRGNTATLIVKDGTLKNTDIIGTGSTWGKIKVMEDFQGNPIKLAAASTPVAVTGFNQVPQVGEKFYVFENAEQAQTKINQKSAKREEEKQVMFFDDNKKVLNLIIKADVYGCLEALKESLRNIPSEEVNLRILKAEVGEVNESDLKLAESSKAKIVVFRSKIKPPILKIAQQKNIQLRNYKIIYELIQGVREMISKMLEPEIIREEIGQIKVLAIFRTEKERQIVGGKVIQGQAKKGTLSEIIREGKKIGQGKIIQVQRDKKETNEVNKGQECGILVQSNQIIEKGDLINLYQETKQKRQI